MPQHSTLADSEIHYCKHITTATTADKGKVITPSSTTNGISELRKLTETDMDYTTKSKNLFGWNDIADSQYTSGAPRALVAATRTQLTNNGLASQSDTTRLGTIWNTGSSYFQVDDLNATYILQLSFKTTVAAAAGTPYIILVETETTNGPTVIRSDTHVMKGGGNVNAISVASLIYVGSFINDLPLKIFLTADTATNVYDIGFVIQRLYREK
jgi:hypothetical protein